MFIYMAGSLSLLWWLATGLHLQEGALDVPLEPLTFVLVHLPLLPFQSLSTWRGDDPCTVISFVITVLETNVFSQLSWD